MRIIKDKLILNNSNIKFNGGSFIGSGENKIHVSDININYENFTECEFVIKNHTENFYIDFGQLSENQTFFLLKVNNVNKTLKEKIYTNSYIEYSFISDISERYRTSDIIILSSVSNYPIGGIYLSNVTDNDISIKVLMSNDNSGVITTSTSDNVGSSIISGLVFNDIVSDDNGNNKSSMFLIKDINGRVRLSVKYNKIIDISISNNILIVQTDSNENITLSFISDYHAIQAMSRLLFALDNKFVITYNYPSSDNTAPSINFINEDLYVIYNEFTEITKEMLLSDIVFNVYDYDDNGNFISIIDFDDVQIFILDKHTSSYINSIKRNGEYIVFFKAKDRCGNISTKSKNIIADK